MMKKRKMSPEKELVLTAFSKTCMLTGIGMMCLLTIYAVGLCIITVVPALPSLVLNAPNEIKVLMGAIGFVLAGMITDFLRRAFS